TTRQECGSGTTAAARLSTSDPKPARIRKHRFSASWSTAAGQNGPSNPCRFALRACADKSVWRQIMEKFVKLTGVAAPLPVVNVDTDMIIPKDYLKTIKRTGLGKGLFAEARYNEDGSENSDFVLNKPAYRNANILVAGDNCGCGSSREDARWALLDFGIRCVIATSFADIFYNNCFKNGILPITVSPEDLEKLLDEDRKSVV